MFICRVIAAHNDYIVAVDVQLRTINDHGDVLHSSFELGGKVYFNRNAIVGYSKLYESQNCLNENNYRKKLLDNYANNIAQEKRNNFKIITKEKDT